MYRVCQGTVIEYRSVPNTNERQIISVIHDGGFAGVTESETHPTTGEAVAGTRLEPIPRSSFVAMLLHEPGFAATLRQHLIAATSGLPAGQLNSAIDAAINDWEQLDFFDESDDGLLARGARAILEGESRCAQDGYAVSVSLSNLNASDCAPINHHAFHRCLLVLRWRRLIAFSTPWIIDILDKPGLQRLATGRVAMDA